MLTSDFVYASVIPYSLNVVALSAFPFNLVSVSVLVYASVIPYPLNVVSLSALLFNFKLIPFIFKSTSDAVYTSEILAFSLNLVSTSDLE